MRISKCFLVSVVLLLSSPLATRGDRVGPYTMIDLGTMGAWYSHAYGVNSIGHVVGGAYESFADSRAFIRTGSILEDIGPGEARKINDQGQVIARAPGVGAYLWQAGVTTPLGDLGSGTAWPEEARP